MPTQPYEPLLNRDMSKVLAKPITDIASPLLQEAVNYATNLYQRCQTTQKGAPDEAFPVLASYLHIIQMTDSIDVLISNGCGAPTGLLLRSSFEARLAILYILERHSKNRAIAWIVKNLLDQIDSLNSFRSLLSEGTERSGGYATLSRMGVPPPVVSLESVQTLEENLKRPEYAEVYSEYERLKRSGRRNPEWYSLFKGPHNLRELARHVRQDQIYDSLYPSWSRMSHVQDASHLTLPLEDGSSVLGPIRNPMHIVHTATFALSILLETSLSMLNEYRADEISSFSSWYKNEMQAKHEALVKMEISEVQWFHKTFVQKE